MTDKNLLPIDPVEKVLDILAEMLWHAGAEYLGSKADQRKLKQLLNDYLLREKKYNDLVSLAEEIDFEGLRQYMIGQLPSDFQRRILGTTKTEREEAFHTIRTKAYACASATTDEAKKRVVKFISDSCNILREFYIKKLSTKDKVLAVMIVDDLQRVSDENHVQTQQTIIETGTTIQSSIQKEINAAVADIKDTVGQAVNYDKMAEYLRNGDIDSANRELDKLNSAGLGTHNLAPYYAYEIQTVAGCPRFVSKPQSKEALQKYPPRYEMTGTARIGDKYIGQWTEEERSYAYRHQQPVIFSIEKVVKFLGNEMDIVQAEAQAMIGSTVVYEPPEFPKAQPFSIRVDGVVYYEYVELRTERIEDDGIYVFSNREQENKEVGVVIRASQDGGVFQIFVDIHDATNAALLKYNRFTKAANAKGVLGVYSLVYHKDFFSGVAGGNCLPETGFPTFDDEIDFLDRLVSIEHYLQREIIIPHEITKIDYDAVIYLSDLISGKENEYSVADLQLKGAIDDNLRKMVAEDEGNELDFILCACAHIVLFGESLSIEVYRQYTGVKIDELDRMKQLVQLLRNGEQITLRFISTGNGKMTDRLLTDNDRQNGFHVATR